jgi:NAD(P)-dependent dehydrogenase (short-subunit alcohol dehydrogenase family)
LLLNAGVVTTRLLKDYTGPAAIRKDLEINLLGVMFSAHFFAPMLKRGSKILMVSSGFGLMGAAGYSVYCAAKAGVVNFAEALRRELLSAGINVYVACPGDMDTPQLEHELKHQPVWMKTTSPRKVLPVDLAAGRILKQCKGSRKHVVLSSFDVTFLSIASKLLPRTWRDRILDSAMPRPR